MIYEKKSFLTKSEQFDLDTIYPSLAKSSITQFKKEDIVPYVQKPVCYRKLRKSAKKQSRRTRKKGLLSKVSVLLVTLLFCAFVTDARFFDGAVADKLYSSIKKEFFPMFGSLIDRTEKRQADSGSHDEADIKYLIHGESLSESSDTLHQEQSSYEVDTERTTYDETAEEDEPLAVLSPDNGAVSVDGEIYYPITELDLSAESVAVLSNNTSYKPDMSVYIENENKPSALRNMVISEAEPLVLIVHTHGSECYTRYDGMYPQNENTRSEDIDENVVRVGKEIADTLETYGIPVLHLETMCDKESFIDAYNVSNRLVRQSLEEHPSIRIVIDVHRDAIIRDSGESIKPTVTVAGQEYAQLMFVVGTDEAGYNHPLWRDNLAFAAWIQNSAGERYPGLFRPINLRPVPFNQWLSDGYILLEVGSNSNTLDEALLSAQAFGHTLAAVIKEA